MLSQLLCPDRNQLQDLLNGLLADDEQQELTRHLDTCGLCQRSLEDLAGGHDAWPGAARSTSGMRPALESALRVVMDELKEQADEETATRFPLEDDLATDLLDDAEEVLKSNRFVPYQVTEVIGRGGMGVVLKAFDAALNRYVAIKALAPQLATSPAARRRFAREARAAAAVSHEHVVAIHAVDTRGDLPYLVMQYVPGISLQQRLDRTGPLELLEILRIGMQTAQGLAAAHAQGLVHRDVKPANILLENGIERVKLTDFGLARAADDASMTQSGLLAGTPQYMAPEQSRGEGLDHRADLFSLGSVLYSLCTGRAPFRAPTTLAVLRRVSDDTPRPIRSLNPAIPAWLVRIIEKLHAKDPAHRFQSAAEVAELLAQCLTHVQAPNTIPLPAIPGAGPQTSRSRPRWRLAAAVLLVLGLGLGVAEATGATHLISFVVTTLRFNTPEGVLVIEVDDPDVKVTLDGQDVVITGAGVQEVRLKPGQYKVRAAKPGTKPFEEVVTISRGGRQAVKVSLERATAARQSATENALHDYDLDGRLDPLSPARQSATENALHSLLAVTFTPDGQRLVTSSNDGAVRVWDPETGKQLGSVGGAKQPIGSFTVLPDGKTVVILEEDGTVRLFELSTGKQVGTLRLQARVHAAAFSPDGRRIATSNPITQVLHVWDAATGKEIAQRVDERKEIRALAFSPDGKLLASSGLEPTVRLWDVDSGKELKALEGHAGTVRSVAFSPDGKLLATAGPEVAVQVWELSPGRLSRTMKGHTGEVSCVVFSPDGKQVASGGADGTIRLWDQASGKEMALLRGHTGKITSLAFSPDGQRLVSGSADGTVKVWDMKQGTRILLEFQPQTSQGPDQEKVLWLEDQTAEWQRQAEAVRQQLSQSRENLEAATRREQLLLYVNQINKAQQAWQSHALKPAERILGECPPDQRGWEWRFLHHALHGQPLVLHGHTDEVLSVAFSPDGQRVASGSADKTIRVWDWTTGRQVLAPIVEAGFVRSAVFSPDGQLLASADSNGVVHLWDARTGKLARTINEGQTSWGTEMTYLAFSPDGKRLAGAGAFGSLRLYDVATGKVVLAIQGPEPTSNAPETRTVVGMGGVVFSPDGKLLAFATRGQMVYLYDAASGRQVRKLPGGKLLGRIIAFSPDGRQLAAAGPANAVYVWDVATGRQVHKLTGHEDDVTAVVFSPDGRRLASCGRDRTVRIWDAATGQQLLVLTGHTGDPTSLAFSPDGQVLVTGSADKTVRVWDARSDAPPVP